jgi:hypothetical protein
MPFFRFSDRKLPSSITFHKHRRRCVGVLHPNHTAPSPSSSLQDGELHLSETADSNLLADLLAGNPQLETVAQPVTAIHTPAAIAPHPRSYEQAITPSGAESSKAELKAAEERAKLLLNLKRQKADKARIRKQMEADRKQVACRKLKSSQSKLTNAGGGANVARYADIGVDLNSGGG